jgi:peptidoglycan/LPS O-acetylase OafA/YrhL
MTTKNEFRIDVQVLRGVALIAVVFFHAFEKSFPNGYLGVDVFFLISGFVITPQIIEIFNSRSGRIGRLKSFYIRRLYRLIPALGATIGFSSVLMLLLGSPEDHERFARQGIATLLFGGNFGAYLFSQDYFSPNPNPLVHTWSLAVEQQFYIFLPLVLGPLLFKKIRTNAYLISVFVLISIPSLVLFIYPTLLEPLYSRIGINLASQFSFYSTIDRVWQFALGSCACLILRTKRSFNFYSKKIIGMCIVLLVLTVLFAKVPFEQQTGSVLISALTLLAIVSKSFNFLPAFFKPKLEWVGDRSYSIYLVHMPLLYLTRYSPTPIFGTGRSQFAATVGAVGLSFVLGALSFSKIENRFRKSWITNVSLKRSLFRGGVAALVLPGCLLLLIDIGSRNQYWGFENDLKTPLAAWELDAGCGHFGEISEPCLVSFNEASETMLLIGDSHAIHLYPALFDAAKDRSLNTAIWTKGGCQVQFKQSEKKSLSDECLEQNLNILEWVKTNRPSLIVISQYVLAEYSQSDLRNTLMVLQSVTPNILLIENTPVFPDESRFMVRLPLLFPRYDPPKTFLRSKMHLRDNFASDELGDWARANQIDTVNLSSLFCSDDLCNRFSDAGWLYSDDDHLSLEGAKLATKQFEDYLRDVFQK